MPLFAGFGTLVSISDMHLSDFLCVSLAQCNIPGLGQRKKVPRLVNSFSKKWYISLLFFCVRVGGGGGGALGFQIAIFRDVRKGYNSVAYLNHFVSIFIKTKAFIPYESMH